MGTLVPTHMPIAWQSAMACRVATATYQQILGPSMMDQSTQAGPPTPCSDFESRLCRLFFLFRGQRRESSLARALGRATVLQALEGLPAEGVARFFLRVIAQKFDRSPNCYGAYVDAARVCAADNS